MKRILLIATGGTIAARPTGAGLTPMITSDEILEFVPEVGEICQVSARQISNIDSTNMNASHWLEIVRAIAAEYDRYDGFVISHGTDTMAYTAAALSYLIQNAAKPIVLTGSQKSIFLRDTDARTNLINAFCYAADDRAFGVRLVFDGMVIDGTRARKVRTKSFNAFSSMDFPELGVLRDRRFVRYIQETRPTGAPRITEAMNDRVFVLKLIPGLDASIFSWLHHHYDALVIESFGVGGVPIAGDEGFLAAIDRWVSSGKVIVMTTQVPHEGSDMEVYQVGKAIKEEFHLMETYDMTLEATVTKVMWVLGQTKEPEQFRRLFYETINHDILLKDI